MKKCIDFITCNVRQLIEVLLIMVAVAIPWVIDLKELFKDYLANSSLAPDNIIYHMAIAYGGYVASIFLTLFLLVSIRKFNENHVMNRRIEPHDYCFFWYFFCAKVLGIKKCNLVHVPIHMQFKLVIRGTFEEYPLVDEEFPVSKVDECRVSKVNSDTSKGEINIILEDTYIIEDCQIPESKKDLFSLRISRNDGKNKVRHYSENFVQEVTNALGEFERIPIANVYATTNPKNTYQIARRVFAIKGRGNIDRLYVFQQHGEGQRGFEPRGHKIF